MTWCPQQFILEGKCGCWSTTVHGWMWLLDLVLHLEHSRIPSALCSAPCCVPPPQTEPQRGSSLQQRNPEELTAVAAGPCKSRGLPGTALWHSGLSAHGHRVVLALSL